MAQPAWVLSLLGMLCITIQAYQFNFTINRAEILGRESHIHGAVYILVCSMAYTGGSISDQMIAMFFIIPALGKWWNMAEQRQVISTCFDSAFLLSVACIIYLPNVLLIWLAFASLMLFRTFNVREAVYLLIGLILPPLFWITACYVWQYNWLNYSADIITHAWSGQLHWVVWYAAGGLLVVVALLHYLSVTPQQVMRIRRMRSLIFIYLLLAAVVPITRQLMGYRMVFPFMALLPVSIFISGWVHMPVKSKIGLLALYLAWFTFLHARLYGIFNIY